MALLHDPFERSERGIHLLEDSGLSHLCFHHSGPAARRPLSPSLDLWNAQAEAKGCQAEFPRLGSCPGDQSFYV